jgi:hypothetical protein
VGYGLGGSRFDGLVLRDGSAIDLYDEKILLLELG